MPTPVPASADVTAEDLPDGRMRCTFVLQKDDANTVRAAAPARNETTARVVESGIAAAIAAGLFY